ncbi:MAG: hemerythrin domain-containing protein, partial [Acidimicrobiales bacterium]
MPTREQALSGFRAHGDYEAVGRQLGIPAGQAFMVATGLPADGGSTYAPDELQRPGMIGQSNQFLVYPGSSPENPTSKPLVHEWIKRRTTADEQMRAAAAARDAVPGEVEEPEETDICTVLTRVHDQVTAMLEQVETIPGVTSGGSPVHLSRRKSIIDMITVTLSQHEATEQEHFWPVVRKQFEDGHDIASEALQQEQEGRDLLQRLGELEASDEEFD